MNQPEHIINAQLDYLLEVVNKHRDTKRSQILQGAQQQAQQIVRHAYRDGRERLQRSIEDNRRQLQRNIASAKAKLHTRERLHKQQTDREFLELAWLQLHDTLAQRWQSTAHRHQWQDMVLQQAAAVLLANSWQLEHPVELSAAEQARLQDKVRQLTGNSAQLRGAENLRAGIRILADCACVDGSIDGLLAKRLDIEAQLLSLAAVAGR